MMDAELSTRAPAAAAAGDGITVPLLRADIVLRARRSLELPKAFGDALRSAFGWALKSKVCVLPQRKDCHSCPLRASCAYGALYEPLPPSTPLHPSFTEGIPAYVLDPPDLWGAHSLQPGQTLNCGITLLPSHQLSAGLFAIVLRHAIAGNRRFFGQALELDQMTVCETGLVWPSAQTVPARPAPSRITLRFDTPLSMKKASEPLLDPALLRAEDLSRLLWRRLQQIAQLARLPLPDATPLRDAFGQVVLDTRALTHTRAHRAPRAGQRKHPLGGLLGPIMLDGPPQALARIRPLLQFCQPLHIGRHTVFGLGRYRLGTQ